MTDVEAGRHIEDSTVELKRAFPEPSKAAVQLAGLANAGRTSRVLLLVGADDRDGKVPGVNEGDLATWFPQVAAQFDEVAPTLDLALRVPWGNGVVSALLFGTTRRPYVLREGSRRRVLWRHGDHTNEAGRGERLELLVESIDTPTFEVLGAGLTIRENGERPPDLVLVMAAYQQELLRTRAVLPYHRMTVEARTGDHSFGLSVSSFEPVVRYVGGHAARVGIAVPAKQLELDGPQRTRLVASTAEATLEVAEATEWTIDVRMGIVGGGEARTGARLVAAPESVKQMVDTYLQRPICRGLLADAKRRRLDGIARCKGQRPW